MSEIFKIFVLLIYVKLKFEKIDYVFNCDNILMLNCKVVILIYYEKWMINWVIIRVECYLKLFFYIKIFLVFSD